MDDPKNLLTARLEDLLAQLDDAGHRLKIVGIDETLHKRIVPFFVTDIAARRGQVQNDLDVLSRSPVASDAWARLVTRELDCRRLFDDILAFLQGARTRGRDVDGGLCEIADAMLDELDDACELGWHRFTMLADAAFFSDDRQIVRLRFPFCGVWGLPVAAHEFGHFAAFRLGFGQGDKTRSLEFKSYLEDYLTNHADLGREWRAYLEEFFADVFATFTMGPSYLFTSMLLQFAVSAANDATDTHPSYARRAYVMQSTLRRMNLEADSSGDFDQVIQLLDKCWKTALDSANSPVALPPTEEERLSDIAGDTYRLLSRAAGRARYNRWQKAKELQSDLIEDIGELEDSYGIRDLLNAAWLARFVPGQTPATISDRVVALYHCGKARHHG